MRTPAALLVLLLCGGGLLFAAACDPPKPAGDPAKSAESKPGPADPSPAEAAKDPPAPKETYSDCLAACGDSKLSADDRATCRLKCDELEAIERRRVGAAPSGPRATQPVIRAFRACADACTGDVATRATCVSGCVDDTSAAPSTLEILQAKAGEKADTEALKACAKGCLSAMVICTSECTVASADDHATCDLQCGEKAAICSDACR